MTDLNLKILKMEQAREELEAAPIGMYVCSSNSYFDDDVKLKCEDCKKDIVARPYYPRNKRIVCVECAMQGMDKQ